MLTTLSFFQNVEGENMNAKEEKGRLSPSREMMSSRTREDEDTGTTGEIGMMLSPTRTDETDATMTGSERGATGIGVIDMPTRRRRSASMMERADRGRLNTRGATITITGLPIGTREIGRLQSKAAGLWGAGKVG